MSDGGLSGTPWRSLHPMSVTVNLIPQAWKTLKGFWPLALAMLVGTRRTEGPSAVDLSILGMFFALTVFGTVVHYLTLRYRMNEGRLEIRTGLLSKQIRVIDPARIQNIELVRNLFHKWSGLVELRVETAGGTSTEGLLSALSMAEAEELQSALRKREVLAESEAPPADDVLLETTIPELIAYGLTQRRLGAVAVLMAFGFEVLGSLRPDDAAQVAGRIDAALFFAALLAAFAVSWIVSGGNAVLKHHGFRLLRRSDLLVTEEGLTTRRRIEIPVMKVQLVRIDEPLVRRWLGYATVLIETAGLGVADGRLRQAEGVLPMVGEEDLGRIVDAAAPIVGVDPRRVTLRPPHRRALVRAIIGRVLRFGFFCGLAGAVFYPWGFAAFAILPLAFPIAWLDWRTQGWLVTPAAIVCRRGFFTRKTWVLARDKLQSAHVTQGPLLRWNGLARVVVRVAGTTVALPDVGFADGMAIHDDLAASWARRPG